MSDGQVAAVLVIAFCAGMLIGVTCTLHRFRYQIAANAKRGP